MKYTKEEEKLISELFYTGDIHSSINCPDKSIFKKEYKRMYLSQIVNNHGYTEDGLHHVIDERYNFLIDQFSQVHGLYPVHRKLTEEEIKEVLEKNNLKYYKSYEYERGYYMEQIKISENLEKNFKIFFLKEQLNEEFFQKKIWFFGRLYLKQKEEE